MSLAKLLGNAKTRTIVLVGAGVIVVGVFLAVLNAGTPETRVSKKPSLTIGVPRGVDSTPGAKTSEKYRELQKLANKQGAEAAAKTGKSFIPTLVGEGGKDGADLQSQFLDALNGSSSNQTTSTNPQLDALKQQQELQRAQEQEFLRRRKEQMEAERIAALNQARMQTIETVATAMEKQVVETFNAWNDVPQQTFVQGENGINDSFSSKAPATESSIDEPVVLKAGNILFGVLETSVNSDEPSPIMAKIIQPPLKNAKLIGTIKVTGNNAQNVTLSFDKINIPGLTKSYSISAVAIDPDTARTALSSKVDNHYFERWGSLFASAFLEGYAKAVSKSGATQITTQSSIPGSSGATTTTTAPPLDGRQQLYEGLGQVGESWSSILSDKFNRKPTITIDAGVGIGILLTSDLTLADDISQAELGVESQQAAVASNTPATLEESATN